MEDGRVVVVGAGLAGLVTAWKLTQAGKDVVVLETADHVGGRALTRADGWQEGQYADLGGELIDLSSRALIAVCHELGVELTEPMAYTAHEDQDCSAVEGFLRVGRFVHEGRVLSTDEKSAVIDRLRTAFAQHPPETHEIVEQWIRRARLDAHTATVVRSVSRMLNEYDTWDSDMHFITGLRSRGFHRILGGTQVLARALAERVDVRLGTTVTKVVRHGGVEVHTATGEVFTGSRVICATNPYGTTMIGFDPPLPDEKVSTILSLLPAMGGKVIAQYAEGDAVRTALSHLMYSDGPFSSAGVSNPHVTSGPAVVAGYLSGVDRHLLADPAAALDRLDQFVALGVGHAVTRLHGEVKNWWADPLFMSMTVTPPEAAREEIASNLCAVERRTHLAGDYTDAATCGTFEGAVRSGIRAADEVLRNPVRFHISDVEDRLVKA
jgi:monoamine oxidase